MSPPSPGTAGDRPSHAHRQCTAEDTFNAIIDRLYVQQAAGKTKHRCFVNSSSFFLMKLYYSAYKVGFDDFILFKQSTDIFTSTTVSTNKTLSLSIHVIHLVHYSTLLCFILLNIMLVLQYHTYKTGTFIMKSYFVMR